MAVEDDAAPDIEQGYASKRVNPSPADDRPVRPSPSSSTSTNFVPLEALEFTSPLLPSAAFSIRHHQPHHLTYHYNTHDDRSRARKRAKRAQKRINEFTANKHAPRPEVARQHAKPEAAIPVNIPLGDLPANSSGYEGLARDSGERKPLQLAELVAEGYDIRKWDGR